MKNWLRQYRLLAGVPGSPGFEIGEETDGRALHISFSLEKTDTESSNTGKISISNLNDEHRAVLKEKGCVVELRAGYGNTISPIFIGGVVDITESLDDADLTTEIEVLDGFHEFDRVGSISLSGVIECQTVIDEIIELMGIPSVHITEKATAALAETVYDNGYCYVGKLKTALQNVCTKAGLQFSLQNGVLQIYEHGEGVSAMAYEISAETGLISIPKKITISDNKDAKSGTSVKTSTKGGSSKQTIEKGIPGYEITFFINGCIGINDLVVINSSIISGVYLVKKMKYEGDNYTGDWVCTAQVIEVKV